MGSICNWTRGEGIHYRFKKRSCYGVAELVCSLFCSRSILGQAQRLGKLQNRGGQCAFRLYGTVVLYPWLRLNEEVDKICVCVCVWNRAVATS